MPSRVNGEKKEKEPKKLILCFDGTGNEFTGSDADTNVVKILNKLDRQNPKQYHYYQAGVGTYDINETSVHKSWIGETKSSISQTVDQMFGTTFDAHVMAGYRFLMRYYSSGDKIYVFGFSRGAFTARFLARMVHTVGLLCKGNEELVPFAYRLFQRYRAGEIDMSKQSSTKKAVVVNGTACGGPNGCETDPLTEGADKGESQGKGSHLHEYEVACDEVTAFSNTFCRQVPTEVEGVTANVKVFFLGIWDCVNSVAVLEKKTPVPAPVRGTADYIRHAVAIDERRVKFKPALFAQDVVAANGDAEDIKEVWFPGGHSDVGGGWPAVVDKTLDTRTGQMTFWQRVKNLWTTSKGKEPSHDVRSDPFQMSDIPLDWMIREMELVGKEHPEAAVKWADKNVNGFKHAFQRARDQALNGYLHDALEFGRGTGLFTVLLWKFMEWLPFITRWEMEDNVWVNIRFPLNKGSSRDIPRDAVLHESVLWRLQNDPQYNPPNNHGGTGDPCLKNEKKGIAKFEGINGSDEMHSGHRIYRFSAE
ncbi:Uncharacterized alpha/beta hydrolase domain (DUF2235) [Geosmithia morbida]|uniref:Uncharacterized alpha/beta hydrolase domain (DUF2235) n=1 Tax=Geosmithia morbida TaxID=1094350 RepID=A0A9P5D6T0_9HYPO|nr:Uncharacterized alpha/beta hydrolase domain (DUF2235) [Geosmithia morbida]KAF4123829.1 Uncharacterized alpha/beta hydrolase domain (DUF2235) [Geosmithia morbida]